MTHTHAFNLIDQVALGLLGGISEYHSYLHVLIAVLPQGLSLTPKAVVPSALISSLTDDKLLLSMLSVGYCFAGTDALRPSSHVQQLSDHIYTANNYSQLSATLHAARFTS